MFTLSDLDSPVLARFESSRYTIDFRVDFDFSSLVLVLFGLHHAIELR